MDLGAHRAACPPLSPSPDFCPAVQTTPPCPPGVAEIRRTEKSPVRRGAASARRAAAQGWDKHVGDWGGAETTCRPGGAPDGNCTSTRGLRVDGAVAHRPVYTGVKSSRSTSPSMGRSFCASVTQRAAISTAGGPRSARDLRPSRRMVLCGAGLRGAPTSRLLILPLSRRSGADLVLDCRGRARRLLENRGPAAAGMGAHLALEAMHRRCALRRSSST